jgi:RHS repeat-associated protein
VAVGGATTNLTYDTQGHLTQKGGQTFTFDRSDLLLGTGGETYRYDADGRRTVIEAGAYKHVSIYDNAGRLLVELDPAPPTGCKPAGDRIFCDSFENPPANLVTTDYVYLGRHLLAKEAPDGLRYLHTDALGSLVAETNASATVTQRYHYLPYGGAFGAAANGPGYSGAVMEPNGLVYMQARYYDPQLGRFLSTDPVEPDPQSGMNFNRYVYANANPYRYIDPDGRCGTDIPDQDDVAGNCHPDTSSASSGPSANDVIDAVDSVLAPLGPDNPIADLKLASAAIGIDASAKTAIAGAAAIKAGAVSDEAVASTSTVARIFGDLTAAETEAIQKVVNRAGRPLEVVGSAARGARTAASDIDYVVPPSSLRYFEGLESELPGLDPIHGIIPGVGNPNIGPILRFEPEVFP